MLNLVANGPSGYTLSNSLRFRQSASAYLSRTFSAGNQTKWTWSGWVKRGAFSSGTIQNIFGVDNSNRISFSGNEQITIENYNGTGSDYYIASTPVYRDPSSWYHIVVVWDSGNATAANRQLLYVNGQQITAFTSGNAIPLNATSVINSATTHNIGRSTNVAQYFDGYLTEVNFIDGQALTPSSFGSTNALTGVWQPAKYTGTYGTNGFYLPFTDNSALTTASNVGLGKDFSGNSNYWVTNNISITAGTTYDSMTDVTTLTSATVANYSVMNPLDKNTSITVSNANLTVNSASTNVGIRGTFGVSSGKWYYEGVIVAKGGNDQIFGVALSTWDLSYVGSANGIGYGGSGSIFGAGVSGVATFTTGDIIGVAFDVDALTIKFYKNNVLVGAGNYSLPSAGTYFPAASVQNGTLALNFGQRPFSYTPPTGFVALNTYNLPTNTIVQGNKYMDATIWTGDGSTNRTITNTASFKPDFVWLKERDISIDNILYDSIRGPSTSSASKALSSNQTIAEGSENDNSTYGYLDSFTSSGFTVVRGSNGATSYTNKNAGTYVGWQWQAGQGSTSSNTSGSITSTVSVNASAGFSIVTYTGTGANATVGHGLGVAPKMIITKQRNAVRSWGVYHVSLGAGNAVYLDLTQASAATTNWNSTTPTSSVFSVGTGNEANASGGTMVAYCWAEIAGFSAFGSYTGNGSADGPFIYTGFRPKFIMRKCSSNPGYGCRWEILDTSRSTYNQANSALFPNYSNAEDSTAAYWGTDILSNGFKLRNTDTEDNVSGQTYIYAAFAENPFKNALAR